MTTIFFSSLSFVAVFGSGIRDPGWVKIRIRDKHHKSATLLKRGKNTDTRYCTVPVYDTIVKTDPNIFFLCCLILVITYH
jgi:hypothetical protein